MMQSRPKLQTGGSKIFTLIVLAGLTYGVFIGIQYVPQWIESRTIQSILDDMQRTQGADPVDSEASAKVKLVRMLQMNEMNEMTENFTVSASRDSIGITFDYERDLNLIYKTKTIHYRQSVRL